MYKIFVSILAVLLYSHSSGQIDNIDTTISLNLLKANANPALNMLGLLPSEIHRPTDLTSFALSVQNAANDFNSLPKSFGLEVAPFLSGKTKYNLHEFDKENTFKQTFSISLGYTFNGPPGLEEVDSLATSKVGLGFKFSIIRPRWASVTHTKYEELVAAQKMVLKLAHARNMDNPQIDSVRKTIMKISTDSTIDNELKKPLLNYYKNLLRELNKAANNEFNESITGSQEYENIRKIAALFQQNRKGFFLDFDGGIVIDFPTNRFEISKVLKAGSWLTGGYQNDEKGIQALFITRYLFQPNYLFADDTKMVSTSKISTLDIGTRLLIDAFDDKLTLSSEYLYRGVLGSGTVPSSWRLVVNAEYDLGMNKKITFAFGRNFDGVISKGGNLISTLNFITGLGSRRGISKM